MKLRHRPRSRDDAAASTLASPGVTGDDEGFESRLVWILGSPRTGSSWLLRLLTYPLERDATRTSGSKLPRRARARPAAVPIDEPYLPQHLSPMLEGFAEPGSPTFLLNPTRAEDPNYFFSDAFAPCWRPQVRQLILLRLRAQADLAAGEHSISQPLVVVKEPNGSHGAELLMSLLPRSRMIFQLRDGRDVIDSLLHAQTGSGWLVGKPWVAGVQGESERLWFVSRQAKLWVNRTIAVQRAYDAHPPELKRTVRYEDLRADTAETLRGLLRWLAVERSEEDIEAAVAANRFESLPARQRGPTKPMRAATPGLWRENMTAREREAMEATMGPKLAELGYEV